MSSQQSSWQASLPALNFVFFLKFFNDLFIFHVQWCFACINICIRVSEPLEPKLQLLAARELKPDPLEEQTASALNH